MTAPIVLYGTDITRWWIPDYRFDADHMHNANYSVPGQLWSRVAEGRKQVWS
jgi:hypothetical protein